MDAPVLASTSSPTSTNTSSMGASGGDDTRGDACTPGEAPFYSDECLTYSPTKPFCDDVDQTCKDCSELQADHQNGNEACAAYNAHTPICDEGVCRGCLVGECAGNLLCNNADVFSGSCQPCDAFGDESSQDAACADQKGDDQICIGGMCGQCGTSSDCNPTSSNDICDPGSHQCVHCGDLGPSPACEDRDPETPICTPHGCDRCIQHSDCDSTSPCDEDSVDWPDCIGACDIRSGSCFPPDAARLPYTGNTLHNVESDLDIAADHVIIRLTTPATDTSVTLLIGDKTVAILSDGESWSGAASDTDVIPIPILDVQGTSDSSLYIDGLEFDGAKMTPGLIVNTGEAWLSRIGIHDTYTGHGLVAGDLVDDLVITNTIIEGAGFGGPPIHDALRLLGNGTVDIRYSTIVWNEALIDCEDSWNGEITNSILGVGWSSPGCSVGNDCNLLPYISHSVVEDACIAAGAPMETNSPQPDLSLSWWGCTSEISCSFYLAVGCAHELAGVGEWSETLWTPTDIDGVPRPAGASNCQCSDHCDFPGANLPAASTSCAPPEGPCP